MRRQHEEFHALIRRLAALAPQVLPAAEDLPAGDDATAEQRLAAVAAAVREMHDEGDIGTNVAGQLLILLGEAEHVPAHPSEADKDDMEPDDTWIDAYGRAWVLAIKGEGPSVIDRFGNHWHWAGGFEYCPDKQPLMTRHDYRDDDVPLSRVRAAAGPLTQDAE